jgi:ubiquinol-cytochrome c reductase iron-sulfur subunit
MATATATPGSGAENPGSPVDEKRRRFLTVATSGVAAVGVVAAAVPFLGSWNPSAKAKAAGAPVKADISKLEEGAMVVVEGLCTHLGCAPKFRPEVGAADLGGDSWVGGFFCPCHGSKFDLAGRVFSGVPASSNLVVPPYSFEGSNVVVIGVDAEAA